MSRKRKQRERNLHDLFGDRRVQLLLGKFLSGELTQITPVLDPQLGYRYPEVEEFIPNPEDAEAFLLKMEEHGLLNRELCAILLCCPKCGSCNLDGAQNPGDRNLASLASVKVAETAGENQADEDEWRCGSCGDVIKGQGIAYRRVYCYHFSKEGVDRISDRLVVAPVREFLQKRGYATESPGKLIGESEVQHSFDIIAYGGEPEEGVLAIDFVVSDRPVGEEKVIAMFAKVFDTAPLKAILIIFPKLTEKARRLAEQYKLVVIESGDVKSLYKRLLKAVPPVEEIKPETLDVMTLLSLPDHLRKTAMVVCRLGKATAEEIAEGTGRARAVESGYLNQLVRMGYLKKERRGRQVLFSVVS
ncbi:hypothetical protein DRO42_03010 [Candidatus Bathyarchaeota archaeon]|nr:MAG: hypothetical protein DRO42_03010 [Candidatus Bathyarchaeota archaeon]